MRTVFVRARSRGERSVLTVHRDTWDLYLDRDSLSRVQACVQRRRLASSFQRAKSTTSRTGGTSRRCRNRFCTLNERGVEEDERMKEEKTERRRQSLSKRAKNLLLRGRGYFSRRTTFLTKLNVFFTLPREKKVRRYLKRGCSPEISLSLSLSLLAERNGRDYGTRSAKREGRGAATPSRARISSCNFCTRSN